MIDRQATPLSGWIPSMEPAIQGTALAINRHSDRPCGIPRLSAGLALTLGLLREAPVADERAPV
jgi:hypothetical protein